MRPACRGASNTRPRMLPPDSPRSHVRPAAPCICFRPRLPFCTCPRSCAPVFRSPRTRRITGPPPLALHCPAPLFRLSTAALNAPAPRHTFNMRPRPFFCLPILRPARPAPPVSACPRRVLPGSPRPPRRSTSTISPFSLCKRTHLPRFFAPHSIKRDKIGNIENNHRHFTRFVLQWTQFKAVFP